MAQWPTSNCRRPVAVPKAGFCILRTRLCSSTDVCCRRLHRHSKDVSNHDAALTNSKLTSICSDVFGANAQFLVEDYIDDSDLEQDSDSEDDIAVDDAIPPSTPPFTGFMTSQQAAELDACDECSVAPYAGIVSPVSSIPGSPASLAVGHDARAPRLPRVPVLLVQDDADKQFPTDSLRSRCIHHVSRFHHSRPILNVER